MGSDVGQTFPTASLHRDHSILYALVCEKELSHMGKNNRNPDLVCKNSICKQNNPRPNRAPRGRSRLVRDHLLVSSRKLFTDNLEIINWEIPL